MLITIVRNIGVVDNVRNTIRIARNMKDRARGLCGPIIVVRSKGGFASAFDFILSFMTIFTIFRAMFMRILEFRKAGVKPSFSFRQH
jgi:hypothetical protein